MILNIPFLELRPSNYYLSNMYINAITLFVCFHFYNLDENRIQNVNIYVLIINDIVLNMLIVLVHSCVPPGSVLGPILFTMYIKPLSAIIDSHSIIHHSFDDDLQLQMSAPPDRISELLHSMQSCICDVKAWATANMLKLNDSKTELMLVTSKRSKHLHNLPTSITIGNAQIPFKQSVKNLGFTLECHFTMNAHVSNIARTCYF